MKRAAILALIVLALTSTGASAQTKKGTTKGRAPAASKTAAAAAAQRAAADRIVGEVSTISNFLFLYGGIVNGIEASEQTANGKKLPPATQALIEKNKAGVVDSIHNLQDGLRKMEIDFSADPNLKTYYQNVNKLSEDVGLAADAADAGKYDDAGKRLIQVVESLARALAPQTP
jgi:hypothetical protein